MAWPEDGGNGGELLEEFKREFPPPYEGEPPDLRRDIADELADHLACAVARERERTGDETTARRAALERFGDPRALARKLWFEAMKERIMKDRIMFVSVLLLALAAVAGAVFSWQAFQQSQRANQAMLAALEKLAGGQNAMSKDKGELQVTVTKGDKEKTPVKGLKVMLRGQLFGPNQEVIDMTTDERGNLKCGPVNPGRIDLTFIGPQINGMEMLHLDNTVVFAGQQAKVAATYPDFSMTPVSLMLDRAAEYQDAKCIVCGRLVVNMHAGDSNWDTVIWVGINTENSIVYILPNNSMGNNTDFLYEPAGTSRLNQPVNWPAAEYRLTDLVLYAKGIEYPGKKTRYYQGDPGKPGEVPYFLEKAIKYPADQLPTYKFEPGKPNELKMKLPDDMLKKIKWVAMLKNSPDEVKGSDPILGEMVVGQLRQILPVTKDCMILSYLPDCKPGEVNNIALANNDGGVRTLFNWPEVKADEATKDGRKYYLALYSHETKDLSSGGNKISQAMLPPSPPPPPPPPMMPGTTPTTATMPVNTALATTGSVKTIFAHAITADWPELTSWKTQPVVDPQPAAQYDFQPGNGWKLFDVTSIVRARAAGKDAKHGIMLRFAREDRTSADWMGYQFVSREGEKENADKHPVLLAVDEKP